MKNLKSAVLLALISCFSLTQLSGQHSELANAVFTFDELTVSKAVNEDILNFYIHLNGASMAAFEEHAEKYKDRFSIALHSYSCKAETECSIHFRNNSLSEKKQLYKLLNSFSVSTIIYEGQSLPTKDFFRLYVFNK